MRSTADQSQTINDDLVRLNLTAQDISRQLNLRGGSSVWHLLPYGGQASGTLLAPPARADTFRSQSGYPAQPICLAREVSRTPQYDHISHHHPGCGLSQSPSTTIADRRVVMPDGSTVDVGAHATMAPHSPHLARPAPAIRRGDAQVSLTEQVEARAESPSRRPVAVVQAPPGAALSMAYLGTPPPVAQLHALPRVPRTYPRILSQQTPHSTHHRLTFHEDIDIRSGKPGRIYTTKPSKSIVRVTRRAVSMPPL
jgi:hypothetical protein